MFLGFFGGALVSPVLSPMFLHPVEHGVLPDGTSMAQRVFLLGVAMGMMRLPITLRLLLLPRFLQQGRLILVALPWWQGMRSLWLTSLL